jgi:hypothetical protein
MNKKFIYSILILTLLVQYSCKKQLDALPKNAEVQGNAIVDQNSANIALNGVYYNLAHANGTETDWTNNKIMGSMFAGYIGSGNGASSDEINVFDGTTYTSEWGHYYMIINAANGVNDGIQSVADNKFANGRKTQIIAEARFLRAYGSFKALTYFGQWFDVTSPYGIIIADKFNTLTNINKPRSTVKDSYDFILSDLDYAIANAAPTSQNIYANKWTAMALKMRVLLSRGQGDDLTQAITLGNSIISGSPYVLEPNEKDIFYSKGLASNEVMLGIQPQANQELYYYNVSGTFIGASSFYIAKPMLYNLLKNDPRLSWVIGDPKATNYYFIKYIQPTKQSTVISETAYAFRLSEVYLMLAEAIARSGGDLNLAKTTLKTVMSKAGVTDFSAVDAAATAADVQVKVYYEFARNFVGEDGIEWMALLRLPFATVEQIRPTITNKIQYILPIPDSEFTNNPNFGAQNPGYSRPN